MKLKLKQITLSATLKNREGAAIPYEIKVNTWAAMDDLLVHVRKALVDQHGLEGGHELCGLRWVFVKGGAA